MITFDIDQICQLHQNKNISEQAEESYTTKRLKEDIMAECKNMAYSYEKKWVGNKYNKKLEDGYGYPETSRVRKYMVMI